MEESKKNNSIIFVIIIVLLLIGMGVLGFLLYNSNNQINQYMLKSNTALENSQNKVESQKEIVSKIEKTEDELFADYMKNYIAKFENMVNYVNDDSMSNKTGIYIQVENPNKIPGVSAIFVNKNFETYLRLTNGTEQKINTDCVNIYLCNAGNGGFADLLMLKKDGTVDKLSGVEVNSTNKYEVKKVENVKNVINVVPLNLSYKFVTISGK